MKKQVWVILYTLLIGFVRCNIESAVAQNVVKTSAAMSTTPGTVITDLQVEAVSDHGHSIQLLIKWNGTYANDSNIDIHVTHESKSKHCTSNPCYEYNINPFMGELRIPQNPSHHIEPKKCDFEPGCTYLLEVKTTNWKPLSSLIYKIPDCVDDICSCYYASQLPNVTIRGRYSTLSQTIDIDWNITTTFQLPTDVFVDHIVISLYNVRNQTLPLRLNVFEPLVVPLVMNNTKNSSAKLFGVAKYKLPKNATEEGRRYKLEGHVIDNRNCKSTYSVSFVEIPGKAQHQKENNVVINKDILWMLLAVIPIAIVIFVAIYCIRYQRKLKRIKRLHNWQGIYRTTPFAAKYAGGLNHVSMQENVLYIDTDILEARARGEADSLEIPHSSLIIGREIGKGAFGRVFIARAENIGSKMGSRVVAVKQLKKKPTADELEEFLSEIATMKKVGRHPNVVSLLGCCTIRQPLLMVMEYVGCGDLLQYLRQVRAKHEARSTAVCPALTTKSPSGAFAKLLNFSPSTPNGLPAGMALKYPDLAQQASSNSDASYITQPDSIPSGVMRPSVTETLYTTVSHNADLSASSVGSLEYVLDHKELHNFAIQIARGMSHLEERKITHRDLAARNILIDELKTLKISDFGLSRTGIYVNTRNKRVPLRWLSIEAVRDNLYSSKSDVWAFGIVLWEIGTLGGFPYPTIGNHELLSYLMSGRRLQRPDNCTEDLYRTMLQCWQEHPEDRPTFDELVAKLEPPQQKIYIDFNDLGPDYVFPPISEEANN
ncbi:platelet-derived growth factor receptor beta-like isoform X2 [Phlebotomus argentipes]|uniref:platelet-derived growth factor receptor beta-like isoform X2 n=1 Tax=Phlebotomus argentipes TaxID=94469 RepID=UPI0028935529|nr:platelet-derived growth factor receptor beta-like isoform X2 [Phlebotomus argentipes]